MTLTPQQAEEIVEAAKACVQAHNVVISAQGQGWRRHVEEPLWQLRKALRRAGIMENQ